MNVLLITTNFPRWEGDPHSPWLLELLGLLRQPGPDGAAPVTVEVLAPAFAGLPSHTIDGMTVHRFRYAPAAWETLTHEAGAPTKIRQNPLYLLLLPVYILAGLWAAVRLARQRRFDVIHVHWPVPQGIFGVVARAASPRRKTGGRGKNSRPRLVATFYGADLVLVQRFPALGHFLRWFLAGCDDVAAISSYTRRELTKLAPVSPRTIPYGISLPPAEAVWPPAPGKILFVGRLIPRKGVDVLLDALAHMRDAPHPHLPDPHLTVVGDGPQRPALEKQAAALGLGQRVRFAGRVSDEELQRHYQTCALFVLPAVVDASGDTEMLGMVLLEAMRYRKPVLASNVGGIPDIVEDGVSGLLVPQRDPAALARALACLLGDEQLARRLGDGGYRYAQAHFGWGAVLRQTRQMYGLKS